MNITRAANGNMPMIIALGLAALIAPLNSTMVAVALPDIRKEFDVGVVAVTWLVTGYLVAVAVSQPIGGRLGDSLGHLRVLKAGLVIMAVFSVLSAFAPDFTWLVALRSIQGIAAAFLIPNATAFIRRSVEPEDLGHALGLNGAFVACGAAAGPVVGGLLVAAGDWRLLFLANLPVALVAMLLVSRLHGDVRRPWRWSELQLPSILALIAAFTGIALAGPAFRGGSPAVIAASIGLTLGGSAAYAAWYFWRRSGIVDLRLFSRRAYASSATMTSLSNLVMYTVLIAMPVYLRDYEDLGSAAIGAILFAMSVTMACISPFGGRLASRVGVRLVLTVGASILVGGAVATVAGVELASVAVIVVAMGVIGTGVGLTWPAQQTAGLSAWPADIAGSAAGTLSLMRYVGSVAGASLFAAVLGSDPTRAQFEALLAAVSLVAIANLAVAFIPSRTEAPDAAASAPLPKDVAPTGAGSASSAPR